MQNGFAQLVNGFTFNVYFVKDKTSPKCILYHWCGAEWLRIVLILKDDAVSHPKQTFAGALMQLLHSLWVLFIQSGIHESNYYWHSMFITHNEKYNQPITFIMVCVGFQFAQKWIPLQVLSLSSGNVDQIIENLTLELKLFLLIYCPQLSRIKIKSVKSSCAK